MRYSLPASLWTWMLAHFFTCACWSGPLRVSVVEDHSGRPVVSEILPINRHFVFMEPQGGISALIAAGMAMVTLALRMYRWAILGKQVRKDNGHLRAQRREEDWYPQRHSHLIANR